MNPTKVRRERLNRLTDLPNIGPSLAADLVLLGISSPTDLIDRDPYEMYRELSVATDSYQDPCVLDVFISITRFMDGEDPKPWWEFTAERKRAQKTREMPSRNSVAWDHLSRASNTSQPD